MFVDILQKLYRSQSVSFPSSYTTEVAIRRLARLAQRPAWHCFSTGLVGKVTPTRVTLWHVKPFFMVNSFRPIFTGVFTLRNGVTVLSGYFATALFARVFLSAWYSGLAVLAFIMIAIGIVQNEPLMFLLPLVPCAMGVGGIAIVYIGLKDSASDVAYISEAIHRGIGGESLE